MNFVEKYRWRLRDNGDEIPSPDTDVFKTNVPVVEVAAAAIVADSGEQRQGMNEPTVVAFRFLFVLVEINELLSVEVDEELMLEREI